MGALQFVETLKEAGTRAELPQGSAKGQTHIPLFDSHTDTASLRLVELVLASVMKCERGASVGFVIEDLCADGVSRCVLCTDICEDRGLYIHSKHSASSSECEQYVAAHLGPSTP